MNNKTIQTLIFIIVSVFSLNTFAAGWNASTHDLVAGDFNADGKDDMLYVAKDPASQSGIVLADDNGELTILHQFWDSNHLGLNWHSGTYTPHVGDFNGDNRADVFMDHNTNGSNYVLLASASGTLESKDQTIANTAIGLNWGTSRLVFGDFNGDTRTDVYLQPKDAQTSSRIVFATTAGTFTTIGDTWGNEHLGFHWSQNDAVVYAGDFDGQDAQGVKRDDLLIQAKPDWVMIPYSDLVIPVQRFEDQANGIVMANAAGLFSAGASLDFWSSEFLNINWSPDKYQVIVGDYNNDGKDDIFLQALQAGQQSFVLSATNNGQFSTLAQVTQTLDSSFSAANYNAIVGSFTENGPDQLYLQAKSPTGSNSVTSPGNNSTPIGSKTTHNANQVTNVVESPSGTAVGKLPGQFSVDPSGGANYNIPIAVAPGVAGMQPELSLAYNSRGGNGQFGVGWSLTGLSAISRCSRTIAQDGSKIDENYTVDYSVNDRFCLDGQRLNLKTASDTYGAANVEYRTEIETFQKVTGIGQVQSAPASFKVIDKTGMTRFYGDTTKGDNSRVDLDIDGVNNVKAWPISRIEDRFGNYIKYNYEYINGELLVDTIEYANSFGDLAGKVDVVYDTTRPDETSGYGYAGEQVSLTHRAKQIDVYSVTADKGSLAVLRSYFLGFEQGTINNQSYIKNVQQCDGNDLSNAVCLPATTFDWNHGSYGYTGIFHDQNIDSGSSIPDFQIMDLFGDGSFNDVLQEGRIDLGESTSSTVNLFGGLQIPVLTNPWDLKKAIVLDYDGDGRQDLLASNSDTNEWDLITSKNGTEMLVQAGITPGVSGGYPTAVDITQDGLPDLLFASAGTLKVMINSATGFGPIKNLGFKVGYEQKIIPIEYDGDSAPEIYITTDGCLDPYNTPPAILPPGWIQQNIFIPTPFGQETEIRYINTDPNSPNLGQQFVHPNAPPGTVFPDSHYGATSSTSCAVSSGVLDWNGTEFVKRNRFGKHSEEIKFLDINGDGLTDSVNYLKNNGVEGDNSVPDTYYAYINVGKKHVNISSVNTFFKQQDTPLSGITSLDLFKRAIVADHNRDGKSDLLIDMNEEGGQWKLFKSNGVSGFDISDLSSTEMPVTSDSSGIRLQDWTGDGVLDYVYIKSNGASGGEPNGDWRLRVIKGLGSNSGKLTKVTDGLGNYAEVTFKPLTDNRIYTGHENDEGNAGNNSQVTIGYPYANFMAPMDVVSSYSVSSGNGGKITTTHKYAGAKTSLNGRGFLGFWRNTAFNSNTNTTTVNFNSQQFPFTGSVRESTQLTILNNAVSEIPDIDICDVAPELCDFNVDGNQIPNNLNIAQASSVINQKLSYASAIPSSSLMITPEEVAKITTMTEFNQLVSSGGQVFPYVNKSTETHQNAETSGIFKRIVTVNNYDNWGCAQDITVNVDNGTGGDKHTVFTDNTFKAPDANKWILCRLSDVNVDHTRAPHITANTELLTRSRHSSFAYDDDTGVVTSETVEPNDTTQKVTKTYQYDVHGNRKVETISYQDVNISGTPTTVSRTTSTGFDTMGLYPKSLTNAKNHVEYYDWNYKYGTRIQTTGPNGLSTESKYNTFGQMVKAISARRAKYGTTDYLWCSGQNRSPSIACESSFAVYAVQSKDSSVSTNGGITGITEFDSLGREVHVRALTFDAAKSSGNVYTHRQTRYDVLGRAYAASLPYFANEAKCWALKQYDMVGRTVREGVPKGDGSGVCSSSVNPPGVWNNGNYDVSTYLYNGLTTVAIDPNGRASSKTTNVMDRLLVVTENEVSVSEDGVFDSSTVLNEISTRYDYDALGNLTYVVDDADNVTQMSYDIRGNKTSMNDPDMGVWTYQYNALGQLVYQKDAAASTPVGTNVHEVRMVYDELGRLAQRVEEEGTTTWEYDTRNMGIGKLAKVTAPNVTKEFIYTSDYGELSQVTEIIDGERFATNTSYDNFGRAITTQYPSVDTSQAGYLTASKRYRVRQFYNANGFASHIQEWNADGSYGATLWEADEVDSQGNITQSTLGNGVVETKGFNKVNGSLVSNDAWDGANRVIEQNYTWDATGNLLSRTDHHISRHEKFTYDSLYRLKDAKLYNGITDSDPDSILTTQSHSYDTIGNLLNKGDAYKSYIYDGSTGGPHAVNSLTVHRGGTTFTRNYNYDNNGNLTAVTGTDTKANKTVDWTSFNKPRLITKGAGNSSEFWYGPDRSRYKQIAYTNSADLAAESPVPTYNKVTTTYIGGLYERQSHKNTTTNAENTEHHHYISVGGSVIAIAKRFNADVSVTTLNYLHRDHLGSVIAITNSSATVLEYLSYDAWGKRRNATNFSDFAPASFITSAFTDRGYTGHEMLDNVGLIHMNGRVYDAEIARFLSADPLVQFPESTQGFNRYTYVNNNPLSFSDPSGFSLWTSFRDSLVQNVIRGVLNLALPGLGEVYAVVQGYNSAGGDLGLFAINIAIGSVPGGDRLFSLQQLAAAGFRAGLRSEVYGTNFGRSFENEVGSILGNAYGNKLNQIYFQTASSSASGTDESPNDAVADAASDKQSNSVADGSSSQSSNEGFNSNGSFSAGGQEIYPGNISTIDGELGTRSIIDFLEGVKAVGGHEYIDAFIDAVRQRETALFIEAHFTRYSLDEILAGQAKYRQTGLEPLIYGSMSLIAAPLVVEAGVIYGPQAYSSGSAFIARNSEAIKHGCVVLMVCHSMHTVSNIGRAGSSARIAGGSGFGQIVRRVRNSDAMKAARKRFKKIDDLYQGILNSGGR